MDREVLDARIADAIAKLPTELDALVERGKAMERKSANPDGAVPIREHLDAEIKGALFYNFADGAGNSESLWIIPGVHHEGIEALYLCYDHESDLNFYAFAKGEDYEYQSRLYSDLPLELKELLCDGPEGELLTIESPSGDCRFYHGSAVLYLQHGEWIVPESYQELVLELDGDDGGLRYILTEDELAEGSEES